MNHVRSLYEQARQASTRHMCAVHTTKEARALPVHVGEPHGHAK